jgi:hypothetical protein
VVKTRQSVVIDRRVFVKVIGHSGQLSVIPVSVVE